MDNCQNLYRSCACRCFLGSYFGGTSRAELHITPTVAVDQEYSDNFYRTPSNTTSVFVTSVSPGVEVEALSGSESFVFQLHLQLLLA